MLQEGCRVWYCVVLLVCRQLDSLDFISSRFTACTWESSHDLLLSIIHLFAAGHLWVALMLYQSMLRAACFMCWLVSFTTACNAAERKGDLSCRLQTSATDAISQGEALPSPVPPRGKGRCGTWLSEQAAAVLQMPMCRLMAKRGPLMAKAQC